MTTPRPIEENMIRFENVIESYQPPEFVTCTTCAMLMFFEDHGDVLCLLEHGTQCLPETSELFFHQGKYSNKELRQDQDKYTHGMTALTLTSETMIYGLAFRECEEFMMRHLCSIYDAAMEAASRNHGEISKWFTGVTTWCIQAAISLKDDSYMCQVHCLALLLEIRIIRFDLATMPTKTFFSDNHVLSLLLQSATAICGLGILCSNRVASQLLVGAARLTYWQHDIIPYLLEDNIPAEIVIARIAKKAGLCFGRVQQWVASNQLFSLSFAAWCEGTRSVQSVMQEGEGNLEDNMHDGCQQRCELGRSTSAGHTGHMPWCKDCEGCEVSQFLDHGSGNGGLLVFDTLQRKLRDLETGEKYVAISHVWGQKLFGQDTRSLGECALSELNRLAIHKGVDCIWLDTLCVPSESAARRKCIDRMQSIYRDACCVAIYDKGIMTADAADSLGFTFVVSISDWNSRVWTLQEGLLNKTILYVQKHEYIPHRRVDICSVLIGYSDYAKSSMLRHVGMGGERMTPLYILSIASGRTTSHEIDYVCGLGALLPTPIHRIGSDLSNAAAAMAKALGSIDISILSISCPRSDVKGFRWMPLGCKDLSPVGISGISGTVLENGLQLEAHSFPVIGLRRCNNPQSPKVPLYILDADSNHLYMADGGIIITTHVDIDITKSYNYICGTSVQDDSLGFLVSTSVSDVVQYITGAGAKSIFGKHEYTKIKYLIT
ncbi:hypothetical protein BGZ76_006604 [Entomortierella beljakovae]|nr:hypothetical protein BGZ76_006604 [Entomortierella beljakovae]